MGTERSFRGDFRLRRSAAGTWLLESAAQGGPEIHLFGVETACRLTRAAVSRPDMPASALIGNHRDTWIAASFADLASRRIGARGWVDGMEALMRRKHAAVSRFLERFDA